MSTYHFGIIKTKPSRKDAKCWDKIARKHPGGGFVEVNVKAGSAVGINNGQYQGWFQLNNMGSPFDQRRADEIKAECGL